MEAQMSFSSVSPPMFDGENYQVWAVRMETHLEALDLWEAVEEDYEVSALPSNPTIAQLKTHKEKRTNKSKAKACLFAAVSSAIFTRIVGLKSAHEIWNYLKTEYEGDERIRGMQVLNLVRSFEMQRMKDSENIKEYVNRLLNIATQVRLLGSSLEDSRIVQKILVTVPERYEATITTLENTKDLSKVTVAELLSAFQAQEQRRAMRQEGVVEGALAAKHQDDGKHKKNINKRNQRANSSISHAITYVPLYDSLGANAVEYIINHAEVSIAFVHETKLPAILTCLSNCVSHIKTIVSFGKISEEQKESAKELDVDCFSWKEFALLGNLDNNLPQKQG